MQPDPIPTDGPGVIQPFLLDHLRRSILFAPTVTIDQLEDYQAGPRSGEDDMIVFQSSAVFLKHGLFLLDVEGVLDTEPTHHDIDVSVTVHVPLDRRANLMAYMDRARLALSEQTFHISAAPALQLTQHGNAVSSGATEEEDSHVQRVIYPFFYRTLL